MEHTPGLETSPPGRDTLEVAGGAGAPHSASAAPVCGDDPLVAPDGDGETILGEPRWPPVAAMLVFMALNIALRVWLPERERPRTVAAPGDRGRLLVVLLTSNPSGIAERRRLRRISLVLVGLLVAAALWATALLVYDLIRGKGVTNSPSELLASGAVVWLGNNLAFALLYWLIDGGGPIARARQRARSTSRSRST